MEKFNSQAHPNFSEKNLGGQEKPEEATEKIGEKTPSEVALTLTKDIEKKKSDFLGQTETIIKENPNLSKETLGQLEILSEKVQKIANQTKEKISKLISPEVSPISEKLQELSPEELNLIKERYGVSKEEAKELIVKGLSFLGATKVSKNPEPSSEKEFLELAERDLIKEAPQKPMLLDVGESGDDRLGVFVKSKEFAEILGKKAIPYFIKLKYENADWQQALYYREIWQGLSKLPIPDNEDYPRTTPFFSYGIYNQKDKLVAILCFRTNAIDKEIKFSSEEIKNFDKIFYRHRQKESEGDFWSYAKEADKVISFTNSLLNLPQKVVYPLELILSGRKQFRAIANSYRGLDSVIHHNILVSTARLELWESKTDTDEKNRARIFRHEYLHNLDNAILGENIIPFSELHRKEIIEIINKYLFDGKLDIDEGDIEKLCQEDGSLLWPEDAAYTVSKNFTEHWFLPDCPMAGHPKDNIHELFVSALNNYLDPNFQKGIERKPPLEREKVAKMYQEIIELVKKRINEKKLE